MIDVILWRNYLHFYLVLVWYFIVVYYACSKDTQMFETSSVVMLFLLNFPDVSFPSRVTHRLTSRVQMGKYY